MKIRESVRPWDVAGVAAAVLSLFLVAGVVSAEDDEDPHTVPASVGFSGWLDDADGTPLTGDIDFVIDVFPSETGDEAVETFSLLGVRVEGGAFSLKLDAQNPDTWDGSTRWLEVSVNGDVLGPRTAVTSLPNVLRAGVASQLTDSGKNLLLAELEGELSALEVRMRGLNEREEVYRERYSMLLEKVRHIRREDVDGKAALIFEGVNVHIRDGSETTLSNSLEDNVLTENLTDVPRSVDSSVGLGNLIIGYNETVQSDDAVVSDDSSRTGRHNLIVGAGHKYTSFATIVAGYNNETSSHSTATIGGWRNKAIAPGSVAVGGNDNTTSAEGAVAVGGEYNHASGLRAVTVGGRSNTAIGTDAVTVGGEDNWAGGSRSVTLGGKGNEIDRDGDNAEGAIIVGGEGNQIANEPSEDAKFSVIVGGRDNNIAAMTSDSAARSVIVGGTNGEVTANDAVSLGGNSAKVSANRAVQIAGVSQTNGVEDTGQIAE